MTTPASDTGTSTGTNPVGLPMADVMTALVRRPDLWSTALRAALSLAPAGWWRRSPFLPLPDPDWLRFRMSTAYGGDGNVGTDSAFHTDDLITWLEWRRSWG